MKDPVSKYFRIGLVAGMAYAPAVKTLGWAEIARRIATDDYFGAIEVNPLPDDETREAVRAIAGADGRRHGPPASLSECPWAADGRGTESQ